LAVGNSSDLQASLPPKAVMRTASRLWEFQCLPAKSPVQQVSSSACLHIIRGAQKDPGENAPTDMFASNLLLKTIAANHATPSTHVHRE
jgi:hypothetical protein